MGLFSPWFLAGALAVGLPIWLHLLKRSKQDPQEFPSLMFFEHRETSSVMHRRLDFILLFILRTLMLLLLALLFAEPFIRFSTPAAAGERLTVVAVDRSFSMRTKEGGTARLDLAKEEAQKIIAGLGQRTKAQVVALSGTLEAMTQQVDDPSQLKAAVASIKEGDSRADYGVLARYLRTLREQADVPLDVHVVSDLQKSGLPAGFTDLRLDDSTKLTLHPIGKVQPNWAVESVTAPQRMYDTKTVHISATVAGFNAPATTRNVTLILNGKTVASKQVMIAENGRGTAEFTGLEASFGFNKCEVKIDAGDNLPADDSYSFAVERTDPKKVLFIDDGRHPKAERYFKSALESNKDAEFALDVLTPSVAANANYASYAAVVLSEPGNIPSALTTALQQYVERGGGLLVAVGVDSVASMSKVPVMDVAVQGTKLAASTGERFWSAADVTPSSPVTAKLDQLNGVKFYQTVRLGTENAQVLAKLSDGSPLLLERRVGEGYVLAYAASLDERQNDLPYKPIYVVLVQEAVKYLAGGGNSQPVNLPVDSYVELRSGNQKGQNAEVLDPAGQRVLSLKEAEEAPNFALSREGFWDVKNAAGRRMLVAAHADRRESDLTVMDMETQQLWSSTGGETEAAKQAAKGDLTGNVTPWSLAPYLLVLLLLVTLAESVIANRYLRSSSPQETMTKV